MVSEGQVIANRYRLAAVVGQGGMGTVYRAFDRLQQREIALDLVVTIINDGIGLQVDTAPSGGSHHGLTLHNTLLAVIGGTISLSPSAPGGTKLTITVFRHAIQQHNTQTNLGIDTS